MLIAPACLLQVSTFMNFKYLFPFYELVTEVEEAW